MVKRLEKFEHYIWSASVFFLPFLLFESWVLISAANFNATWQSMHCNVWEYSFLPQHLYNCQRKAGTRHGQSITSVNRDVGLFVQYIIVLNIQLLFPPASLQFGSCHHFAIFQSNLTTPYQHLLHPLLLRSIRMCDWNGHFSTTCNWLFDISFGPLGINIWPEKDFETG